MEILRLLTALAPILVVLVLLVCRVPSLWAAGAGLVTAVAGSLLAFPLSGSALGATAANMGPTLIEVALILLGGVGLAQTTARNGAQDRIAEWLAAAESGEDRSISLFLLIFGLTPFMESVTGFGLGVVITAPLLIRLGMSPVKAVVAGLLGLVLVPWGSLGPGTLIAAQLGGQDFHQVGIWSALLTLPVLIVSAIVATAVVIGRPTGRQVLLAGFVIVLEWAALTGANLVVGTPPAGVVASAVVIIGLLVVARLTHGTLPSIDRGFGRALLPYGVLVGGVLASAALTARIEDGPLTLIANPAVWLILAALISLSAVPEAMRGRVRVAGRCLVSWVPITANAIGFMLIGIIMAATGMAEDLAGTAAHIGPFFTALVPAIGALGGYLTGSNTGAAAMLSAATTSATAGVGANPVVALAGQNVAGSFAIIASPPRVALAVGVALPAGQKLPTTATRVLIGSVLAAAVLLGIVVYCAA